MDIQSLFDAMGKVSAAERSRYHLTLGGLVKVLKMAPPNIPVVTDDGRGIAGLSSYRGYYSDLSLEPSSAEAGITSGGLKKLLIKAIGKKFKGYKGGDFVMSDNTPLWFAPYGCCGYAIVSAIVAADTVTLCLKDVD